MLRCWQLICIVFIVTFASAQESVHTDKESQTDRIVFDNGDFHDSRGWIYGFAFGIGVDDFSLDTTRILAAAHLEGYYGWKFNKRISLSSGLGIEFNESRLAGFRFDTQFLTLHLRSRYNILITRYMPFITGRVGYGFGPPQEESVVDHENGINYQVALGFSLPSNKNHKYSFALAWHHQQAKGRESFLDQFGNEINTQYDFLINRLILKFGMDLH